MASGMPMWTIGQVCDHFEHLGATTTQTAALKNKLVNGSALQLLSEAELKGMGLPFGVVKKHMRWRIENPGSPAVSPTPSHFSSMASAPPQQPMMYAPPVSMGYSKPETPSMGGCSECGGRGGHTFNCKLSGCDQCGGRGGHTDICPTMAVHRAEVATLRAQLAATQQHQSSSPNIVITGPTITGPTVTSSTTSAASSSAAASSGGGPRTEDMEEIEEDITKLPRLKPRPYAEVQRIYFLSFQAPDVCGLVLDGSFVPYYVQSSEFTSGYFWAWRDNFQLDARVWICQLDDDGPESVVLFPRDSRDYSCCSIL